MSITIEPLAEADVPTKWYLRSDMLTIFLASRIELDAFKNHPRMPMMWPRGNTSDLYAFKESSDVESLKDPRCKLFKATAADRTILGTAEWTFALDAEAEAQRVPTSKDAPPPTNWPAGGNWPLRRFYKINIERLLQIHFHHKPYFMLNFLTVDPQAQGRGVGSKLLAWGIEEADRQGVDMVLESTPTGFALYQKFGFEQIEVINADMRDFGWTQAYDEDAAVRIFMIRAAR